MTLGNPLGRFGLFTERSRAIASVCFDFGFVSPAAALSLSSGAVIGAFPAIPIAPQYLATGLTNA
jgi:hypothetical protein